MMFANSFKQSFAPVRVGEQVLLICPGGQADSGVVMRGVFNTECMEPGGSSQSVEKTVYEDGSWFSYDSSSNQLKGVVKGDVELTVAENTKVTINGNAALTVKEDATVTVNKNATVSVNNNATLTAGGDVDVDAMNVTCDATTIKLNGGTGVVTGKSICHFTGSPHVDVSKTVFAGKE
ncbi:MAG: phage baseplate assembly protein V [Bacteroidetes bacterium]|nr:phage baseplate assembly protein V [Bacteroidota bacterium]